MKRGKINKRSYLGYFTVEAALVMPIVFVCYFFVMILLCYIYERCIWEQNACRLPVWKEYVEGYIHMYPESAEEISKQEICRYMLECLNEEEESKYFIGQDIVAEIDMRGEVVRITRSIYYPQVGERVYETSLTGVCLDPMDYIRTKNLLKNQIANEEGENDDKE